MAYTNVWNAAIPTGTEAANTIATIFRTDKVNIQDRFMDIFSIPDFTLDPLKPYNLKFSAVPATNDFLMGAANVRFRDSTNFFTNLNISDAGTVTVRNGLVITAGNLTAVSGTFSTTLTTTNFTLSVGAAQSATQIINATTAGFGSQIVMQNAGVSKWSFGLNAATGTNEWAIYNLVTSTNALNISATNAITMTGGLTVNGIIKGSYITLNSNSLEEYFSNATSALYVNYSGYAGGTTQFRDLSINDGKNFPILYLTGSSKLANFYGSVTVATNLTITNGIFALPASIVHTVAGNRFFTGNGTLSVLYSGGASGLSINNQNNSVTLANFSDSGAGLRIGIGGIGVGSGPVSFYSYYTDALLSGNTSQYGAGFVATGSAVATGSIGGIYTLATTTAAAFTCGATYGIFIGSTVLGAGSTITTNTGLYIANQTVGGINYAINCNGGRVRLSLPTSSAGLAVGDLWSNAGVVTVA